MTPVYVSVTGAAGSDDGLDAHAAEVGRLLAEHGCVVVCGGLGGVMEAAARAAGEAGGQVLGIIPTEDRRSANRYCTLVAATGMGQARNLAVGVHAVTTAEDAVTTALRLVSPGHQ